MTQMERYTGKMKLERITTAEHPMYKKALELYKISFPEHEQREAASQERILNEEAYHFGLAYDEETFVGLVLYWEEIDYIYIEHFCILPEMRNKRYGQKTLELLKKTGKTLILEIDPPVDEVSVRRKGFYERCGFAENPYPHVHPPYHAGNKGHELVVMTAPEKILQGLYDRFHEDLYGKIMKDVFIEKI